MFAPTNTALTLAMLSPWTDNSNPRSASLTHYTNPPTPHPKPSLAPPHPVHQPTPSTPSTSQTPNSPSSPDTSRTSTRPPSSTPPSAPSTQPSASNSQCIL